MSGTLNPDLLTGDFSAVLGDAARLQREFRQSTLMPEMILLALLRRRGTSASAILAEFAASRGLDLAQLDRQVQLACTNRRDPGGRLHFVGDDGRKALLSRQGIILIDDALSEAGARNEGRVDSDHALLALAGENLGTSGLLRPHGITPRTVADVMDRLDADPARAPETRRPAPVTRQGDAAAGGIHEREELLRAMLTIINQAINRHLVLVGPPGVGKRTLALSLTQVIARGEGPAGISGLVQVPEADLLDDDLKALRNALKHTAGGILFLPHLQRFLGGPGKARFARSTTLVQKIFLANDPVVVATASEDDWNARLAADLTLSEHCQVLHVPEPTADEAVAMLDRLRPLLERDYQIQVADDAPGLAAGLAKRYLSATPLPRSAENLLHRSAALVRMRRQTGSATLPAAGDSAVLDADVVRLCVSQMSGVPVNQLGEDERQRYARLSDHLGQRLIGQDAAVQAVSRAIRTARVGLKEPQRPIGAFLFLGPTGVGKTHLARALAEFMFGSEQSMLSLDMSEFKDEASINRLLGSPSGYVDSAAGGQLTERVRRQPYLLILFDEVEKAHPRIMDILLQMIEEGRLTDGRGRSAGFGETVLILTSNLGSASLAAAQITEAARASAMEQVRAWFRPELLNRLDDVVMFNALSDDDLGAILKLMLASEQKLAAQRGLQLQFSEPAMRWLRRQYDEPQYGARPLQRIIRRHVRVPLADHLLGATSPEGAAIRIDADDSGLTFATIDAEGGQARLQG